MDIIAAIDVLDRMACDAARARARAASRPLAAGDVDSSRRSAAEAVAALLAHGRALGTDAPAPDHNPTQPS